MSKKPSKSQPEKKVLQIVDQQKDPMLRLFQKKVRNINKKLTQISQLETKKDLKPQQQEKISKKAQISLEKQKYLEMIEIYKDIAAENEKIIRKAQLTQLQDLALALAVKQYSGDLGANFNQNVDNLVKLLTSSIANNLTLQERIKEISTALNDYAQNSKLKKNLKQYVTSNNNKRKANIQSLSNQSEPISPQSEQQREEQLKYLEEDLKLDASQKAIQQAANNETLKTNIEPYVSEQNIVNQTQNLQQPPAPTPTDNINATQSAIVNSETKKSYVQTQLKNDTTTNQKNQRKNGGQRQYQGYRGRKGREGGRNYDDKKFYKKPSFKPKYEQKQQKEKKRSSSSSSISSQQPQARQFKRQEVRELIEDGFIVVAKPKIKAKDQKEYYDHQHGNKHHRHHSKKNY